MHDWYISSTLVEAPTSSLIGTYFMEDLAYMYENSSCCGIGAWWCTCLVQVVIHVDVHSWYTHRWDWYLFEIHDCGTWFMMETYHEWYDTLFDMLVDAHGWHIGRCTCWHVDRGIRLMHFLLRKNVDYNSEGVTLVMWYILMMYWKLTCWKAWCMHLSYGWATHWDMWLVSWWGDHVVHHWWFIAWSIIDTCLVHS